jgi:hypothetical protein
LLVTASVVPGSPILVTLMREALSSSDTLVLTESHGVTSQKTSLFIVTAVKTSNLTRTMCQGMQVTCADVAVTQDDRR